MYSLQISLYLLFIIKNMKKLLDHTVTLHTMKPYITPYISLGVPNYIDTHIYGGKGKLRGKGRTGVIGGENEEREEVG
jgi:hypothetical protein